MRRLMTLLTLVFIWLVPIPVHAQNDFHISLLSVDIWPEYDQPAVLMIYNITLDSGIVLPTSLAIRIPSSGQINTVAVVNSAGNLINTPYEDTVNGQWSLLKIKTNSLQIRIEYYLPLVKNYTGHDILFLNGSAIILSIRWTRIFFVLSMRMMYPSALGQWILGLARKA